MKDIYVLDSSALIAFFFGESGQDEVEKLLEDANANKCILYMSLINYGEVCFILRREMNEEDVEKLKFQIKNVFGIKMHMSDLESVEKVASYKALGGIAYPDCFALVTTQELKGKLVTKDKEFKKFENDVDIFWI